MASAVGAATAHVAVGRSLVLSLRMSRCLFMMAAVALFAPIVAAPPPTTPTPPPASVEAASRPAVQFPIPPSQGSVGSADRQALSIALTAARRGDSMGAQAAMALMNDPVAHKLALWAMIDAD